MKKRIVSLLLMVSLMLSFGCVTASAAEIMPLASTTITSYSASVAAGRNSGEIKISYEIQAKNVASTIGISTVKVYKADGSYVTTIYGSTSNGLLGSNSNYRSSTYTYKGTSGTSYYTVITFKATVGSETDTKEFTTNTIKAP